MTMPIAAARVFWMMLGPMVALMLAFTIARSAEGWLTPADLSYWLVVLGIVGARWLEFQGGNPLTSTGEPATAEDLHFYVSGVLLVSAALWIVANILGNHWLGG